MPWTKIMLSTEQVKSGEIKRLQAKFRDIFNEAGMPTDMAMFAGQPSDSGYYPFYLTPACARASEALSSEYAGVACDRPKKTSLEPTMVIGFNRGWDLLLE